MISVVIPYFQHEPGILANALRSVMASEVDTDVRIIVVDDQSPVQAKSEIATLGETRFPITVIEQTNQGPGGARNTGLDNVPRDTDYVAFLDSDDIWSPSHLNNALTALVAGYDVYFCDLYQLGAEVSAFRRARRINPDQHPTIAGRENLHAYQGDMFDQILTGNIIGTPTVVFDFKKHPALRFCTDLTSAGEDYLYWLDLATRNARFAFGSTPEVTCGKGVNVYAGSGWGTDGHARRIADELNFRRVLTKRYQLTSRQYEIVQSSMKKLRSGFVADCVHRLAHRRHIDWKLTLNLLRVNPLILVDIVTVITSVILKRVSL